MSLFDSASLVVTPSGYKEDKLYSIKPTDGSGDLVVTRSTTATRVNSAGLIEQVAYNLLSYSEQFDNAAWEKQLGSSITPNTTIAPNGTLTADTLSILSGQYLYQNISIIASNSYTISIYVKVASGTKQFKFNTFGAGNNFTSSAFTATTDWQRFNYTFTAIGTGTTGIYPILVDGLTGGNFYIWGAQLVTDTSAKEYFPTTDRLNVPRLDYTNSSCPSILVEPQRTNLQAYSNDFNLWTLVNTTVTANNGISPDGTQNADRVQFSTGGLMYYGSNGSAGLNTLTVYAKAKNGVSANFRFFANGATLFSSNQTATGTWQRFTFTYTYTAITSGLAIATTGADDILFYGFQHEIGSYPTSYITTVASSVTRNADVISKTGISSLIGQTEGTLYVDFTYNGAANTGEANRIINITDGTTINFISIAKNATTTQLYVYSETTAGIQINSNPISGTNISGSHKLAFAYKANDFVLYLDGVSVFTDNSGAVAVCNTLNLGRLLAGDELGGLIKSAVLWKTRLTNVELASLTTL